jgi:hypothetical protein
MNGMFKNSRGLGDLAKHLHIADCCRDYNLDFVAFSKTCKRDYSQSFLDRLLSGGIDFQWFLVHLMVGLGAYTCWHHGCLS